MKFLIHSRVLCVVNIAESSQAEVKLSECEAPRMVTIIFTEVLFVYCQKVSDFEGLSLWG